MTDKPSKELRYRVPAWWLRILPLLQTCTSSKIRVREMTDNDKLRAIESELGKITQGEWKVEQDVEGRISVGVIDWWVCEKVGLDHDAYFITKAPERIRWLVERVRKLEKEIEILEQPCPFDHID